MKLIANIMTCWLIPMSFLLLFLVSIKTDNSIKTNTIVVIDSTEFTMINLGHNIAFWENSNWTYDLNPSLTKEYSKIIYVGHGRPHVYSQYKGDVILLCCRRDGLDFKGVDPYRYVINYELPLIYLLENHWLADLVIWLYFTLVLYLLGESLTKSLFITGIPVLLLIIISYLL